MAPLSVITSNHVYLDRAHPDVRAAVVIEGTRVRAVCAPEDVSRVAGDDARVRDYGDAFVCPGFHDAHQHVFHTALVDSDLALTCPGTSEADCVEQMRAFADRSEAGRWLIGQGWRQDLWDPAVAPTRASLDAAFPDRPVAMYSGDLHTLWVNTRGLEELDITADTVPPAGGSFERDADGRLTGVLREAAGMVYVAKVFQTLPRDGVMRAYRDYFERSLGQGITSVCDMALSAIPGADYVNEDVYEALLAQGALPVRAHLFPQNVGRYERIEALQARLTGELLRAPGTKQFFDGVSSAHTAWMLDEYANARFAGDCGRPTVAPELMRSYVMAAAERGIATRIHTIGDRSIRCAIDIFREARERFGAPRQGANTIEHVEGLWPEDVRAMAEIGLVASVQPQHAVIDVTQPERDLGAERAAFMWPFASFARAGVTMAFGTDSPCVPNRSMQVLSCAVTREVPETCEPRGGWLPAERIGMAEAIDAYTRGSAVACGRAGELGTLAAGMLADVAVLDTNLMEADPEQIQGVRTLAAYVGGSLAWEA